MNLSMTENYTKEILRLHALVRFILVPRKNTGQFIAFLMNTFFSCYILMIESLKVLFDRWRSLVQVFGFLC